MPENWGISARNLQSFFFRFLPILEKWLIFDFFPILPDICLSKILSNLQKFISNTGTWFPCSIESALLSIQVWSNLVDLEGALLFVPKHFCHEYLGKAVINVPKYPSHGFGSGTRFYFYNKYHILEPMFQSSIDFWVGSIGSKVRFNWFHAKSYSLIITHFY